MEERPHLNPHRDRELQVGKAADRMAAGPQSVKAAKVESAAVGGQTVGAHAWRVFQHEWGPANPMERYRPPPVTIEHGPRNLIGGAWGWEAQLIGLRDPRYPTDYHYRTGRVMHVSGSGRYAEGFLPN